MSNIPELQHNNMYSLHASTLDRPTIELHLAECIECDYKTKGQVGRPRCNSILAWGHMVVLRLGLNGWRLDNSRHASTLAPFGAGLDKRQFNYNRRPQVQVPHKVKGVV